MKYFITFTEEGIFNKDYFGYAGGRIEVYDNKSPYDIDEIRFLCPRDIFEPFREEWDFKDVTAKQLKDLAKLVKEKYYKPKD